MASKIKDLIARFRRPGVGSTDVEATLVEARSVLAASEAAVVEADRAYSAGLLEHDAERLRAIKADREAAVVERDRATALVASLETRLAEMRAAEVEAALQADIAKANAEAERVADRIRTRYPVVARELVSILRDITAADMAVVAMNERLAGLGRAGEALADVQTRGLPSRGPSNTAPTIWGFTRLEDLDDFAPGWHVDPVSSVHGAMDGIEPGVSASYAAAQGR